MNRSQSGRKSYKLLSSGKGKATVWGDAHAHLIVTHGLIKLITSWRKLVSRQKSMALWDDDCALKRDGCPPAEAHGC